MLSTIHQYFHLHSNKSAHSVFKDSFGSATLLTIIALLSIASSGLGLLNYEDVRRNTEEYQHSMAHIHEEMKATIQRASQVGKMTQAQADMARHRIDRNWQLFTRLADTIVEKQEEILENHKYHLAVDMLFTAAGTGLKVAADFSKMAKAVFDISQHSLYIVQSGNAGVAGYRQSSVNVADLKEPIDAIRQIWNEPVDEFQKAMVVAKIRIFWDKIQLYEVSKERRREMFRNFIHGLQKQGWLVEGVNFKSKRSIALYAIQEIQKYKKERESAAELQVYHVRATPRKVQRGQSITLEGRIVASGLDKGQVKAQFILGGVPVDTRLIITGRIDVPATAIAKYTVPDDLAEGKYEAELRSELKTGNKTLTARATTELEIYSETKAAPKDPFTGTWSGIERVRESSSISFEEMKEAGLSSTFPLNLQIRKSGIDYHVSGIPLLKIKKAFTQGKTLIIIASGSFNPNYMKFDAEKFMLTLHDNDRMLVGTHRIDFAVPDKAPPEYRDFQINDVRLTKQ